MARFTYFRSFPNDLGTRTLQCTDNSCQDISCLDWQALGVSHDDLKATFGCANCAPCLDPSSPDASCAMKCGTVTCADMVTLGQEDKAQVGRWMRVQDCGDSWWAWGTCVRDERIAYRNEIELKSNMRVIILVRCSFAAMNGRKCVLNVAIALRLWTISDRFPAPPMP